jgi:hypothetical protein
MTKELRTATMSFKVKPSLKKAIDQAAYDDHRPTSSQVEMILTDWLQRRGYLPKEAPLD